MSHRSSKERMTPKRLIPRDRGVVPIWHTNSLGPAETPDFLPKGVKSTEDTAGVQGLVEDKH